MGKTRINPDNFIKNFLSNLRHESYDSLAYELGDFFYQRQQQSTVKERKAFDAALAKVKKSLNQKHVSAIWESVNGKKGADWEILSPEIQVDFNLARKGLLRDLFFIEKLTYAQIRNCGNEQVEGWWPEILIALIRKKLIEKNKKTALEKEFGYEILEKGDFNQNFSYVGEWIKQCEAIPQAEIIFLGKKKMRIAEGILKYFEGSDSYFRISAEFARTFPTLRESIANGWESRLQLYPQQNKTIGKLLSKLLVYPAFQNRNFERICRYSKPVRKNSPPKASWKEKLYAVGGALLLLIKGKDLLSSLHHITTVTTDLVIKRQGLSGFASLPFIKQVAPPPLLFAYMALGVAPYLKTRLCPTNQREREKKENESVLKKKSTRRLYVNDSIS